jgi:hypothetical protein
MRVWGLRYPGLLVILLQRMQNELAANPDTHLGPMAAPTTTRAYRVELTTADGMPEALLITLYVDRDDTQRLLSIVSGRLATEHFLP